MNEETSPSASESTDKKSADSTADPTADSTADAAREESGAHVATVPSRRGRLFWAWTVLSVVLGVLAGVGTFTFGYGKGASYLSNNPQTCANCHVMQEHFDTWQQSSHHHVATCNDCHTPHDVIGKWVDTIQSRTRGLMDRAAVAMTDMLDAIVEAQQAGATEKQLVPIRELQKKAMWRLDCISSENSKGFHADQEAARVLGESIDYSRQAQAAAYRLGKPGQASE